MSIDRGRVVAVFVGQGPARPGLVQDVQAREGNSEPLLRIAIAYDTEDGGPATVASLTDVPNVADAPDAHWRWQYGGPELLVRKPLEGDPNAPTVESDPEDPAAPTPDAQGA